MAQFVTITTTAVAASTPIVLNPVAKSTTLTLTSTTAFVSGSSNATLKVEYSLDDPTIPGGPTTTWALLSSGAAIASTDISPTGLSWTVLSPIGQARVSVNVASTAAATFYSFVLKALQSVTA